MGEVISLAGRNQSNAGEDDEDFGAERFTPMEAKARRIASQRPEWENANIGGRCKLWKEELSRLNALPT